MSFLQGLLKRPIAVFLLSLGVLIYGSIIVGHMGIAALPNLSFQTLSVQTSFPGASTSEVALSVTKPLEKELIKLQNLKTIRSYSSKGASLILLDLDEKANLDSAYLEAALITKAQEGNLPKSLRDPPLVSKSNPTQAPIYFIGVRSLSVSRQEITRLTINTIAPQFSMIKGVSGVNFISLPNNAYRVQVNPDALYQHNLSILDLYDVLSNNLTPYSTGILQTPEQLFSLKLYPKFTTLEELQSMAVPLKNGTITLLKNLAVIKDSFVNDKSSSIAFGAPAAVFGIVPKEGANTIEVALSAKKLVDEIQKNLPAGVSIEAVFDRTEQIQSALFDIQLSFFITVLLVMGVIYFFLKRVQLVGIVAYIIVLSMICTCGLLYVLGHTLNVVTFLGLIIAVGFVVDDAVIVMEAIIRHQEEGKTTLQACLTGVKEIFFTIMSISLSLIVVFFPLIVAPGIVGQLLGDFSLSIIFSVIFSLLFSFMIIPVFINTAKANAINYTKKLSWFDLFFTNLTKAYERSLLWAFNFKKTVLGLSLTISLSALILFVKVPHSLFPPEDTGMIILNSYGSGSLPYEKMKEKQDEAIRLIEKNLYVLGAFSAVGEPRDAPDSSTSFLKLIDRSNRPPMSEVITQLKDSIKGIPDFEINFVPVMNLGGNNDTKNLALQSIDLQSLNQEELYRCADALETKLKESDFIETTSSYFKRQSAQLSIEADPYIMATYGLSPLQVSRTLGLSYSNLELLTVDDKRGLVSLIVEVEPSLQQHISDLSRITVRNSKNVLVPLSAFSKVKKTSDFVEIYKENNLFTVQIFYNPKKGISLKVVDEELSKLVESANLPPSVSIKKNLGVESQSKSWSLGTLMLLSLFIVYVILGCLYESLKHPFTIISGLPSAAFGGLLWSYLFEPSLSIPGFIGLILLIGIVKKNAIMLVDYCLFETKSKTAKNKMLEACSVRFRPIMMTTLITILGAIPLAIPYGEGAEFRTPLGIVVIVGLVVSQVVTLYLTPVLFVALDTMSFKSVKDGAYNKITALTHRVRAVVEKVTGKIS